MESGVELNDNESDQEQKVNDRSTSTAKGGERTVSLAEAAQSSL